MKAYRILALTDHRGHSAENSIYALLRTLSRHPRCSTVEVASRGNPANEPFFSNLEPAPLSVRKVEADFEFESGGRQFIEGCTTRGLSDCDIILMRLPRPVSRSFLLFLAGLTRSQVVINDPIGIDQTSSKDFLLRFPDLCPEMRLCHSIEEIWDFARFFPIVLKPLHEYGGKGILKLQEGQIDDGVGCYDGRHYLESRKEVIQKDGILAMKYLKRVNEGDKRILVVGGEILAASLRLPARDSWLCNVAQGGTAIGANVEEEERFIIEQISPVLMDKGILIFGADTLVGADGKRILSEVNTLSIGGFQQAEIQTGKPILRQAVDKIISYVDGRLER